MNWEEYFKQIKVYHYEKERTIYHSIAAVTKFAGIGAKIPSKESNYDISEISPFANLLAMNVKE